MNNKQTTKERLEKVNYTWVADRMAAHRIKRKDLMEDLGLDESTLSILLSGHRDLTKSQRAAFYYYFEWLDLAQEK